MCENKTQATEFLLLGFQGFHNRKILLFILFLLVYVVILSGNLLIFVLVTTFDQLNIPMFYFVKHLAFNDVLSTTNSVPPMLNVLIMEEKRIYFTECIVQLYLSGVTVCVQCFLLAAMTYDRYLAGCNPLCYTTIMGPNVCSGLVSGSWFLVFTLISSELVHICQLKFCGLNYIDHFLCDFGPLVELSTSDTSILMLQDIVISFTLLFAPFVFIITTYILIFFAILSIPSIDGWKKFFSTCSSHLITVCTYYGILMMVYVIPSGGNSLNMNTFRSLLYIIVTHD